MDWKQIILMAKGKAEDTDLENDEKKLFARSRILLDNTIKPAVREVLEFLEENEIPYDRKLPHYIDDEIKGVGACVKIGTDECNVDIFIGITRDSIIGDLNEFRFVHLDRSSFLELPLNETNITSSEVKRLLAEDVRIYYEKLSELDQ